MRVWLVCVCVCVLEKGGGGYIINVGKLTIMAGVGEGGRFVHVTAVMVVDE